MRLSHAICAIAALSTLGCPGFTDEWSGRYRQSFTNADDVEQWVEVDVFRYGHDVQAIVRFFEPPTPGAPETAFAIEERCGWTDPASLDDDGTFETNLRNSTPPTSVIASFDETGDLLLRLKTAEQRADLVLEPIAPTPDSSCLTIPARNMLADFAGRTAANEFPASVGYSLRSPYFGVQWLAVEPIRRPGGLTVYAALTADLVAASIADKMTENRRGLTGQLNVAVEPPPVDFRTVSGTTRYGLAHFIVVDDDPEDSGPFVWDKGDEPIVASGVRRGTRPDAPSFVDEHNQFGLAVLFVEGELGQLDESLLRIMEGQEDVEPDQHFYVVQLYALDDRVTGIRFTDSPIPKIPVLVVQDYLDAVQIPLPRLLPGN